MKKLTKILVTSTALIALSSVATMKEGKGFHKMDGELTQEKLQQHLSMMYEQNPNIAAPIVEEKDGQFKVRIETKEGSLVHNFEVDSKNPHKSMKAMHHKPLTVEQAKIIIQGALAMQGYENLKPGEVKTEGELIIAQIVTNEGSLVKTISVQAEDRHALMKETHLFGKGHMKGHHMKGKKGKHHKAQNKGEGKARMKGHKKDHNKADQ